MPLSMLRTLTRCLSSLNIYVYLEDSILCSTDKHREDVYAMATLRWFCVI